MRPRPSSQLLVGSTVFQSPPLPPSASNRSDREVRIAGLALQTVWGYKDLRRTLEKDGWRKTDFMVNLNAPSNTRANGGYEDSTLPLIDNGRDPQQPLFSVLVHRRESKKRDLCLFLFLKQQAKGTER